LCAKIWQTSQQAFADKNRSFLGSLLRDYTDIEILAAWIEFVSGREEYAMRYAVRDFCTGGGQAVLDSRETVRKEREDYARRVALADERAQAEVAEAKRLREEADQEEERLIELARADFLAPVQQLDEMVVGTDTTEAIVDDPVAPYGPDGRVPSVYLGNGLWGPKNGSNSEV
jgi:hypothetical protein